MNKKILIVLLSIISVSSYAEGIKQHVQVCGNVANELPYQFKLSFQSSDAIKSWKTVTLNSGTACVDHTYREGPKSIRLKIDALGSDAAKNVRLNLDDSCKVLQAKSSINYVSDYLTTSKPNIMWKLNISQLPGSNNDANPNLHDYKVSCDFAET